METYTSKIDFVQNYFGEGQLSRDGTNIAVNYPSCKDDSQKRKFSICLETWRCHCWVCGVKGKNLFKILNSFINSAAAAEYKNTFNVDADISKLDNEKILKKIVLPKDFLMIAQNLNNQDPDFKSVLNYLRCRGVTNNQLWRHKIGTCIKGGYWNRRVIFPSFTSELNLDYYVSRAIDEITIPKYVNAKTDKKNIIFDESRIDWKKELTIVEGVFDLIKSNDNATCLLGSYMSDSHAIFKKIVTNCTPVLLALDHDVITKTYKIAQLLFNYGVPVRIMNTSGVEDVGELTYDEFCKRADEADNYTGDTKINFLIDSIKSGSIF